MQDRWPSRASFILASIGSAIGLGNIWRFPYICYENGGGAFLIPYLVALFTAGIPLMILEFSLGHKYSLPAPLALKKVRKGFEGLGWFMLLIGFGIVTYYAVVMGWCFNYLLHSVNLSWGQNTEAFFFQNFLKLSESPLKLGGIQLAIVLGLVLTWIAVVASVWKGPNTVGRVVYFTVTIPWIILIVLVIRGVTLPGASEGLKFYLTPNFKALLNLKVWLAAYTQVFFSLTIAFGVQITYASFLPRKSDVVNNAFLISLANCATSFVGGFAVFSTLGYYATQSGLPVSEVVRSGPHLAFVTYPTIINMLPVAAGFFGILFFIMLLTLGIDSAFSLLEAVSAGFMRKFNLKRVHVNIGLALIALLIGILYTTKAGLFWLDIVDHFMNHFGLMVAAFLECIAIGYFYGTKKMRNYANSTSEFTIGRWWDFCIKYLTPLVLIVLFVVNVVTVIREPYGGYSRLAEFLGGWLIVAVLVIVSIVIMKRRTKEA
jgi:NSS family neurotransmitter:Na+ symporter